MIRNFKIALASVLFFLSFMVNARAVTEEMSKIYCMPSKEWLQNYVQKRNLVLLYSKIEAGADGRPYVAKALYRNKENDLFAIAVKSHSHDVCLIWSVLKAVQEK